VALSAAIVFNQKHKKPSIDLQNKFVQQIDTLSLSGFFSPNYASQIISLNLEGNQIQTLEAIG
jgi:hypothetical protein